MKKKSNGWTFALFIAGLFVFAHDHVEIGAIMVSWAYYRMGYNDGAKDGARDVFTK